MLDMFSIKKPSLPSYNWALVIYIIRSYVTMTQLNFFPCHSHSTASTLAMVDRAPLRTLIARWTKDECRGRREKRRHFCAWHPWALIIPILYVLYMLCHASADALAPSIHSLSTDTKQRQPRDWKIATFDSCCHRRSAENTLYAVAPEYLRANANIFQRTHTHAELIDVLSLTLPLIGGAV